MFLDYLNNPYYAGKGIRNENVYDTQKFLPYENVCDKLPFRVASLGSWYRYLKRLWPNIYEVYNISYVPPITIIFGWKPSIRLGFFPSLA